MLYIATALSILWFVSLHFAERRHKDKYRWQDTAISKYIKHDRFLQAGFVSLGAGLVLMGLHFISVPYVFPLLLLAGIGALFVMLTETVIDNPVLHVVAAGLTYGLTLIGCVIAAWDSPFLLGFAAANIAYTAYGAIIEDETGDHERYVALGLLTWLGLAAFAL